MNWLLFQRIVFTIGFAMCVAGILIIGREMFLWWWYDDSNNGREK